MKDVKKATDAIREEISKPLPEHTTTTTPKEKKMATKKKASKKKSAKKVSKKKGGKKVKKAAAKKTSAAKTEGGVTLADLAAEAKITGQKARQKLRAAGIERAEGSRWSWKEGSKDLKAVRKALDL